MFIGFTFFTFKKSSTAGNSYLVVMERAGFMTDTCQAGIKDSVALRQLKPANDMLPRYLGSTKKKRSL